MTEFKTPGCACPGLCHVHRMWIRVPRLRDMLYPEAFVRLGADGEPAPKPPEPEPAPAIPAASSPFDDWERNAVVFQVSRQTALDYGLTDATEAEARERYERHVTFLAEQEAEANRDWPRWERLERMAADLVRAGGAIGAVLDLHKRVEFYSEPECHGCESDDRAPVWPCATWRVVMSHMVTDGIPEDYDSARRNHTLSRGTVQA